MGHIGRLIRLVALLGIVPKVPASTGDESRFDLDLPSHHVPFLINRWPDFRERCLMDSNCPFQNMINDQSQSNDRPCFGYEDDCDATNTTNYSYGRLQCPGESNWHTIESKHDQIRMFWTQGDFGYLKDRIRHLKTLCIPGTDPEDSSLICTDHLRYCYAKNIMLDFKHLMSQSETNRYRENVIEPGDIGGRCTVDIDSLRNRADQHSPLQSWVAELKHFRKIKNFTFDNCDVVYEKPVILIKLDAGVSMYHHFCDFVNLYASQHLNGSFRKDVHIVQWDTSGLPYHDFFTETWKVFTDYPLIHLKELDGKKVCFREAMFPLLARMIFGLYYNMPLIGGCSGSGLIHAFSQHVLHRLKIDQRGPMADGRLRVTFLSRGTKYRRILNEDELVNGLKTMVELDVTKVDYAKLPFLDQLKHTFNTDILIGIHGSGLTHLLFLPDWAAVFEIYNCEDPNCYLDLSRLRGVGYFTWERKEKFRAQDEGHHPTMGAHAKFTNYYFDLEEFLRMVSEMIRYVRRSESYRNAMENMGRNNRKDEL